MSATVLVSNTVPRLEPRLQPALAATYLSIKFDIFGGENFPVDWQECKAETLVVHSALKLWAALTHSPKEVGIVQMVERRTGGRKVAGLTPGRSGGRMSSPGFSFYADIAINSDSL